MATILVVDDDAPIREVVQYTLERGGHAVVAAKNGVEALDRAADGAIDLVLLDILMPELDGLAVCRRLRAQRSVPIIFLSSRGEEVDRVLGLELGGDDYVTKPFSPRELAARVSAVLRRTAAPASEPAGQIAVGRLGLDLPAPELRVGGAQIDLTVTEFAILRALLEHPGRVWSRAQIIARVRADDFRMTERTIDTHVRRIRAKLRGHGLDPIETVHGLGYKARAPA